jgi:predicted DNA-binding helix-hairpin-helix protein
MPHTNEEMMEKMAAIEHERWAKWQKYIHSKILPSKDDDLMIIGSEFVERWERQINTPYEQLSEKEKESDREQVRPYLDLISDLKKSIREEIAKEKEHWEKHSAGNYKFGATEALNKILSIKPLE